jgi:hypothetical protein
MMDSDEREVYFHLKAQQEQFVPANSICRHAGGKHRYRDSPDWAKPALRRMLERGILEVDATGAYRLKPAPKTKSAVKRWVSPQIADVLKKSGRNFDAHIISGADPDAYYNNL